MRISIIIPAFNEEARLGLTLDRIFTYLEGRGVLAEFLVVDDGSTDDTATLARAALKDKRGTVLVNPENRGKGHAVRRGVLAASGNWVLMTDADLSSPIEEYEKLAAAARDHDLDVAFGSRGLPDSQVEVRQNPVREYMGKTFNLAIRAATGLRFRDTQCGFKLFPGELARDLAAAQRLDGFAFDVELLLLARQWGVEIREVGVHWEHIEASRVLAIRHSSEMLRDALMLCWWRATGALPARPGNPS